MVVESREQVFFLDYFNGNIRFYYNGAHKEIYYTHDGKFYYIYHKNVFFQLHAYIHYGVLGCAYG